MTSSVKKSAVGVCPKCIGYGRLSAFRHIEGGVCFMCKGHGKISVLALQESAKALSASFVSKCNWILSAERGDYEKLSWKQLCSARDFALMYQTEAVARHVYGESVLILWKKNGEEVFQEKQTEFREMVLTGGVR